MASDRIGNDSGVGGGAALVVAGGREDRRVLFDVLDALGLEAVYSARDIHQARTFFRDDPSIRLVFLEFADDGREAAEFCAEVGQQAPVIGILGARSWQGESMPTGLLEWIASPVRAFDARARILAALAGREDGEPARRRVVEQPDRYQFVFDSSDDELAVVDPEDGTILEVNDTFVRRTGHARGELVGALINRFDLVMDGAQRHAFHDRLIDNDRVRLRGLRARADGSTYPVEMYVRRVARAGGMALVYAFRNIAELTRHREAMAVLMEMVQPAGNENLLERLVGILVEWLAPELVAVIGAPEESGQVPSPLVLHHRLAGEASIEGLQGPWLQRALEGKEVVRIMGAWRQAGAPEFIRANGMECVLALPLADERRDPLGTLWVVCAEALHHDGTLPAVRVLAHAAARELELRRARERDRAISLSDPLTGLPNRLLFNDRLELAIREAERGDERFALVFVDLDRFKNINDSLGHGVGDQVLSAVAQRLQGAVRASDTVARYAGDEFTLILRHLSGREDALRVAEKFTREMEAPLQLAGGLELGMTASLGLSFYPDDATDAERLLKYADVAMYTAKGIGRNKFQAYVAVPDDAHQQRVLLESKLHLAEANGELRAYYQPQVDAGTEDIVGMEALIRWEHPELGMISPGFFIPLAEESGLIVSIGTWILREACRHAQRWNQRHGLALHVGVNLSAVQLRQPDLLAVVAGVLEETELPAHLLDLEITETMSVKSVPNLVENLHALRLLGCSIAIDDFGTGQASLEYLRRFPADRIKVDQSFVRNIGVDPDDEAIVEATISMAHNLNRTVIAEGVETEQHLEFLRRQGCEVAQGFLFSRPLPAAAFERLLEERARLLGLSPPLSAAHA